MAACPINVRFYPRKQTFTDVSGKMIAASILSDQLNMRAVVRPDSLGVHNCRSVRQTLAPGR
jgi:hypothetical protein